MVKLPLGTCHVSHGCLRRALQGQLASCDVWSCMLGMGFAGLYDGLDGMHDVMYVSVDSVCMTFLCILCIYASEEQQ